MLGRRRMKHNNAFQRFGPCTSGQKARSAHNFTESNIPQSLVFGRDGRMGVDSVRLQTITSMPHRVCGELTIRKRPEMLQVQAGVTQLGHLCANRRIET